MKLQNSLSDRAVIEEIGRRLEAIRLGRNQTQGQLATQAGVSKRTIERLESGAVAVQLSGFVRVCRALDLLDRLDAFVPEPLASPIALLKLRGRSRRRASGKPAPGSAPKAWTWSDES
jgi:transcriptional regulator with XRE-family HTH domain